MTQPALFSRNQYEGDYPERPGWKGTAETGREAAPEADADERLRQRILASIRADGPATADELARRLGVDKMNSRPRCSQLHGLGRLVDSHQRRYNASGKRAIVWALAPGGDG